MKIKNSALAGATLSLGGEVVEGDAEGVFDVPEPIAQTLVLTPGWSALKKGSAPVEATPSSEPAPAPEPESEAQDEGDDVGEEVEEVDLDSMTKAELIELAEQYGVELLTGMRKDEIREAIEEALGGD